MWKTKLCCWPCEDSISISQMSFWQMRDRNQPLIPAWGSIQAKPRRDLLICNYFQITLFRWCQINWELDAWLYIDYNSLSPTDNQVMRSLTLLWANPRFVQMLPLAQILLTRQLDASPFDLYIGPLPLSKTTQLDYNWPKNNNYNWPNGFSFCWGAKMSR